MYMYATVWGHMKSRSTAVPRIIFNNILFETCAMIIGPSKYIFNAQGKLHYPGTDCCVYRPSMCQAGDKTVVFKLLYAKSTKR